MKTLFDMSRTAADPALVNERVLAIDFGLNGGLTYNHNGMLFVRDMPENTKEIRDAIEAARPHRAYGENVHAFPGQGVVSVATFMRHAGRIDGILACNDIPFIEIQPEAWVKWYDIGKRSDFQTGSGKVSTDKWKKHLQAHAKSLFPDLRITQKNADSVLIWNYVVTQKPIRPPSFA